MNDIRKNSNKRIKEFYDHLLNDDIQRDIIAHIIDGREPEEIIESLIKKIKVKK